MRPGPLRGERAARLRRLLPLHALPAPHRHRVLARGTSNYQINVPSPFDAGRTWARETARLSRLIAVHPNVAAHVQSAAADDLEPKWDRRFRRTRRFLRGFRAAESRPLLYNFGSLDGGVGDTWSLEQAYYASAGRNTRVVPEI